MREDLPSASDKFCYCGLSSFRETQILFINLRSRRQVWVQPFLDADHPTYRKQTPSQPTTQGNHATSSVTATSYGPRKLVSRD